MAGRVGVLALQGAFREHVQALREIGVDAVEVRRADELEGLAGLVIPGGESTTMSNLIESGGLEEPIRRLHDQGAPLFGTCAGMILLSREAVDGRPGQLQLGMIDLAVRRNAFGRQLASFEAPVRLAGDPEPLTGVFIRAPQIERVGRDVDVLAELEGRPVGARQGPVMVTAFHPELTDDRRLHRAFAAMVTAAAQERAA